MPIAQPIKIKILDATSNRVKVRLPFLDVPVEMNRAFFESRLEAGYFVVEPEARPAAAEARPPEFHV